MRSLMLVCLLLLQFGALAAPIATFEFESDEQEAMFHRLSHELRCLVCQNQSIGDSNADLAKDLRNEIYGMIVQGKTEQQIIDFMVQRYGDFVLYKPPVKPLTWMLWFGPAIVFVIALVYALRFIRAQKTATAATQLDAAEIERLKNLQAEAGQQRKSSHERE